MNPVTVAESIWLHRIKTPAALRREYDFSAEDAKKIIQEALRLDVWTNPYGAGPKTNKLAKLTGFVTRIVVANERRPSSPGGAPKAATSLFAKIQRLTPAQKVLFHRAKSAGHSNDNAYAAATKRALRSKKATSAR